MYKFKRLGNEIIQKINIIVVRLYAPFDIIKVAKELSKQYLMNPTTLKSVFKAVYGDSLTTHMREHRLEKAAILLTETNNSISQIAKAVGYTSQSRFSTAFHEVYQMLPLEYRRIHSNIH